MYAPPWA